MNTDVVAMDVGGDFFWLGGIELEADAVLELFQEGVRCPAMLQEKELEAGAFPVLAQDLGFSENFRDTACNGHDLIPLDEGIQASRKVRIGGQSATHAHRKARFGAIQTVSGNGGEPDVVDFGIGTPGAAASDGYFELAGQIVELGVAR